MTSSPIKVVPRSAIPLCCTFFNSKDGSEDCVRLSLQEDPKKKNRKTKTYPMFACAANCFKTDLFYNMQLQTKQVWNLVTAKGSMPTPIFPANSPSSFLYFRNNRSSNERSRLTTMQVVIGR